MTRMMNMKIIDNVDGIVLNKLKKAAVFSDIHFGRKNNSNQHNQDCLDFVRWFIDQALKHEVDHIIFGGDWFEHRDSLSGKTIDYSHKAMSELCEKLNLPFFFIIGNHDLVYRNNRNIFNTQIFEPFENLVIVNEMLSTTIQDRKVLFCPYFFPSEYPSLVEDVNSHNVVFGHFEFKGFIVTGENRVMEYGPDHDAFSKCKRIFSGHFHKRQELDNVTYIGNTFAMDFSDANDIDRGMMVYDYVKDEPTFINWEEGPVYIKANLSELLDGEKSKMLRENATVSCESDVDISFEEVIELQGVLTEEFKLREITILELPEEYEVDGEIDISDIEVESPEVIVSKLLRKVKSEEIDPDVLIKIYEEAK